MVRLEQNYRSTQNILNAANEVIVNNTERKEKRLWTENEEGDKVHFRQFNNGFEEAEYVAGEIIQGRATGNSSTRTVQYFIGPMPSPVSLRRNFSWQMFLIRLSAA